MRVLLEHLEGLRTQVSGSPAPSRFGFRRSRIGPEKLPFLASSPGDAGAAGPGPHFRIHCFKGLANRFLFFFLFLF